MDLEPVVKVMEGEHTLTGIMEKRRRALNQTVLANEILSLTPC